MMSSAGRSGGKGQVATILTVEDALAVIWRRELDEPEYPNHKKCVTVENP